MKVYIERTAVMNVLEQYYPGVNERLYIVKDITSLPAADVTPVRHGDGRNTMGPDKGFHYCSECKGQAFNYEENGEVIEILSELVPQLRRSHGQGGQLCTERLKRKSPHHR